MHGSNGNYDYSTTGYQWFVIITSIVITNLQIQDLRDQARDRIRGRNTAPILLGDNFTRWSIVILIMSIHPSVDFFGMSMV